VSTRAQLFEPSDDVGDVLLNACFAHWYTWQEARELITFDTLLAKVAYLPSGLASWPTAALLAEVDDSNLEAYALQWAAVAHLSPTDASKRKVAQRLIWDASRTIETFWGTERQC
jgi:hypothetical protein